MYPLFPEFKKLELSDKVVIESVTKNYKPYSDYNFVSLWSYNTNNSIEFSFLNTNLVIRFEDYVTNEPFYSFIGTSEVTATAKTLLTFAVEQKFQAVLKLVPEETIQLLANSDNYFSVEKDESNHDYILSVTELKDLAGNKYGAKRNFTNRFRKHYPHVITKILDLTDKNTQDQIISLCTVWAKKKGVIDIDTQTEFTAIQRLVSAANNLDLQTIGLFDEDTLIGFSINEMTHDHFAIIHFEKADTAYVGVFQYLKQQAAAFFHDKGVTHINYEQDLGIEGLRKAKHSYHPTHFLEKYSIKINRS